MEKRTFDVIVVGAGINGSGIAHLLAENGRSVLLVDKAGVGDGTSSRSSRLIHGGLRYLESGYLHLVQESLRDRQRLSERYPELVKFKPFYLPIYDSSPRPAWMIRTGLGMYDMLAGKRNPIRVSKVDRKDFSERFPAITQEDLRKVYVYPDAKTNDLALTRRVVEDFQAAGGTVLVHTAIEHILWSNDSFKLRTSSGEYQALTLINATGPWMDEFNHRHKLPANFQVRKVSGIHVFFEGLLVPELMFMQTAEKRIFFIIPEPELNQTMVGTTERDETLPVDEIRPVEEDIAYIIREINTYLVPDRRLQRENVKDVSIGVRPLVQHKGSSTGLSREFKLDLHTKGETRLLHVFGGKLTTYLSLAEKVVNLLDRNS